MFTLDTIRDHYMTIGHIEQRRGALANRCGVNISRDEIMQALRELIERGHAKAYDLDTTVWPPKGYDEMPPLEDIKPWGAYFWVTEEGPEFHNASDSWWPFEDSDDDELRLRKDWTPPEE